MKPDTKIKVLNTDGSKEETTAKALYRKMKNLDRAFVQRFFERLNTGRATTLKTIYELA